MIKIKNLVFLSFFIFIITSLYFQIKNIDNPKIGKSMLHVTDGALQVTRNWYDFGIIDLRFNQFFFKKSMGLDRASFANEEEYYKAYKKEIFNCINLTATHCPQSSKDYNDLPYVSYPALGYVPIYLLKKKFPDLSFKILYKSILIFLYFFSALMLGKIFYDFTKRHLKFDKNLKYVLSLAIFLKFYFDSFLFIQFSSIWIAETIEPLFIIFIIYSRYLIHHKMTNKNIYLYAVSLILFSFHNYLAYFYMFFDFLITLIIIRKNMFTYFKLMVGAGLTSIIINVSILYYGLFSFSSLKKIFVRTGTINELDNVQSLSIFEVYFDSIILNTAFKYLILIGFVIILVGIFFKKIFKSNEITIFLPIYLTFFLFFYLFQYYHVAHDFFMIKFHILALLSIIPILQLYKIIFEILAVYCSRCF